MRHLGRIIGIGIACLAATGCITSSTLLKVNADGSGTIEQTLSMRRAAADELKAMMAGFGGGDGDAAGPTAELFGEKEMRDAAARLGEGVAFVSSTPIATADRVGRTAFYKFADVTKLRVDQRPATPGAGPMKQGGAPEEIAFGFTRLPNGHPQLSILFPTSAADAKKDKGVEKAGGTAKKVGQPDPAQLEMMKKLFDGLKIDMAVQVAGPIVKTNSPFVEGSRVTLLEMDFAQLLANPQQLESMPEAKTLEDAKEALKNIKGFKVNLDRELLIEFAPK